MSSMHLGATAAVRESEATPLEPQEEPVPPDKPGPSSPPACGIQAPCSLPPRPWTGLVGLTRGRGTLASASPFLAKERAAVRPPPPPPHLASTGSKIPPEKPPEAPPQISPETSRETSPEASWQQTTALAPVLTTVQATARGGTRLPPRTPATGTPATAMELTPTTTATTTTPSVAWAEEAAASVAPQRRHRWPRRPERPREATRTALTLTATGKNHALLPRVASLGTPSATLKWVTSTDSSHVQPATVILHGWSHRPLPALGPYLPTSPPPEGAQHRFRQPLKGGSASPSPPRFQRLLIARLRQGGQLSAVSRERSSRRPSSFPPAPSRWPPPAGSFSA